MFLEDNEIDLHGFNAVEAIETFIDYYNLAVNKKNTHPIRVIHGYGSSGEGGKIKIRLRNFLQEHPDNLSFQYGEYYTGNQGETIVYPKSLLPSNLDMLSDKILEFCFASKTQSKITGKFRRYGDSKVRESLKNLEKQGKLSVVWKGKYKQYLSAT